MIRSSKHTIKFANDGKKVLLSEFVDCYKSALEFYVSYLWKTRIEHGDYLLDVSQGFYVCPKYIPSEVKPKTSRLTGRALKCAATQASAIVRSVLNKREKDENEL